MGSIVPHDSRRRIGLFHNEHKLDAKLKAIVECRDHSRRRQGDVHRFSDEKVSLATTALTIATSFVNIGQSNAAHARERRVSHGYNVKLRE